MKPLRRIQYGAMSSLAFGLMLIWVAGGPSVSALQRADAGLVGGEPSVLGPILGIIGVILLNVAFVSSETAVELLRPHHVKHIKDKNQKRGDRLQVLIENRLSYIAACRLGFYVSLLALAVMALLLAPAVADLLGWEGYLMTIAAWVVVMLPVGTLNLIMELVPKSYASLHPHGVASVFYPFILGTSMVFWIPEKLVTGVAALITKRFGGKASFLVENQAEEEIKTLAQTAQESGEIEHDERELLHSVFEFSDTVAKEVMTPRIDMDAMPVDSSPQEVIEVIKQSGHSRIPLYEGTDDQIVGIIHAKDLFMAMLGDGCDDLRKLMREPMVVPETKNLHELLTEMRASRSQLAVVQDDFGGTSGVVTIEDIVEELVGDIVDEYDEEEPAAVQTEDGWLVDGKTHLDDLNPLIGGELESEEFDSVGGFVFGLFGRQPAMDEFIETEGYRFTVAETDGRRIHRLHITRAQETPEQLILEEEQV